MSTNDLLGALPRVWLDVSNRRVPAFRSGGIAGFYLAVIATLGAGFLSGRSVLLLAACSALCAFSFFAYALARKWITGRERLVLLEQVWFTELVCFGFLTALGVPPLAYLDAIAVGLCFFLAGGRAGCTLAGCCHGRPSSVGLIYGEEHVAHGFPEHLRGVRLFPVQILEGLSLLVIGFIGLAAIAFATPGTVFVWFLIAYAVMRFGFEGLRGDPRPHLFGFSQSRWMALIELALALALFEGGLASGTIALNTAAIAAAALLGAALIAALVVQAYDPRRALLSAKHLDELRARVQERLAAITAEAQLGTTSRGMSFAVSKSATQAHVSISLRDLDDLFALTVLAGRAFPELELDSAVYSRTRILHFQISPAIAASRDPAYDRAPQLYGRIVRAQQQAAIAPQPSPNTTAIAFAPPPAVVVAAPPVIAAPPVVAAPAMVAAPAPVVSIAATVAPPPPPPPASDDRRRYFGQA